jgi:hypothetical protein
MTNYSRVCISYQTPTDSAAISHIFHMLAQCLRGFKTDDITMETMKLHLQAS